MRLMDRIRAVFTGNKEKERIVPEQRVPDEDEDEIEELIALEII